MADELSDGTLRGMVSVVDSEWTLREATPVDRGFCRVYRLVVGTATSTRECYLKAVPEGRDAGVAADARVSAVVGEHTAAPVPGILGAVDDHPDLPAPYFLVEAMPGDEVPYERVGWVSDDVLRTTARQLGESLGELHRIDAVDSFGYVFYDESRELAGGRPSGTVDELRVRDGVDSWPDYLRARVDRELGRHAESGFSDLTPRLESWCEDRIERLDQRDGGFSPVLGRNDHGLHNVLVDADTGDLTALLDWAYTLAVTPAYDLQFAAYLFGGGFLSAIPEVADRQEMVRDALLAGYRSTAPDLADDAATYRPLYELLAMVRIMNDFEQLRPRLPEGTGDAVAEGLREDVESLLERNSR
ncbi:phosphotransferase family protein [Halorussus sp. AFM4]|uniref:phosphotransferase family protein n=1 Tax=Halorussus sp. AFM4 TaxID=3421651 RepID=UPI003EBD7F7E